MTVYKFRVLVFSKKHQIEKLSVQKKYLHKSQEFRVNN